MIFELNQNVNFLGVYGKVEGPIKTYFHDF